MTRAFNLDCMEYMRSLPDKAFDLAVVDPPYGNKNHAHAVTRIRRYGQLETVNDAKPDAAYFRQLFRVSKNQIIWGYNHLSDLLPSCSEFIFWYKHQPVVTYADGELAWTSFKKTAVCFDYPFFGGAAGADTDGRIHPTQKPVALYRWLFNRYAKAGDKILDTHLGSGSSRIAAYDANLEFVGCEIDPIYFAAQEKRFAEHSAQQSLFVREEKTEQQSLF